MKVFKFGGGVLKSKQEIVKLVSELGLQPFQPPDPLPIIDREEVRLVCWMGVSDTE